MEAFAAERLFVAQEDGGSIPLNYPTLTRSYRQVVKPRVDNSIFNLYNGDMPYKDKKKAKEYARKYQNARHERLRNEVIELMGGRCAHCGNNDTRVLVIDHIAPIKRSKDEIGAGKKSSWDTISRIYQGKEDMNNVQLLCANCHLIKTSKEARQRRLIA